MSERALRIAVLVLRVVLGAIFIVRRRRRRSGHATEFAQQIAAFRLLPRGVVAPLALLLPFLEVAVGAYLDRRPVHARRRERRRPRCCLIFDLAIASAVVRGLQLSCGCFGPNDTTVTTWGEVARDAIFVVLALLVALRPPGALALDRELRNAS